MLKVFEAEAATSFGESPKKLLVSSDHNAILRKAHTRESVVTLFNFDTVQKDMAATHKPMTPVKTFQLDDQSANSNQGTKFSERQTYRAGYKITCTSPVTDLTKKRKMQLEASLPSKHRKRSKLCSLDESGSVHREASNKQSLICSVVEFDNLDGVQQTPTKQSSDVEMPYLGLPYQKILADNLDCDHIQLFDKASADSLFDKCEQELEYFKGDLAKVRVFGKWFKIPRKQVAFGGPGLTYTYSGNTVPARPWPLFLETIRNHLRDVTGFYFSFVLVNRYANGDDYIGEHKDDEKDLNELSPIASISLGQTRVFKFRHGDTRGKNSKRNDAPVLVDLKHGSLLMMNYPTNKYWYHSLPKRKAVMGARVNLTFRDIKRY